MTVLFSSYKQFKFIKHLKHLGIHSIKNIDYELLCELVFIILTVILITIWNNKLFKKINRLINTKLFFKICLHPKMLITFMIESSNSGINLF